jgi:acyl-CoA synthetase (AMP-forming)/AMP-acid ligase II
VTPASRRREYLARGLWNGDTLAGVLALHAAQRGHAIAVVDRLGKRRVSFAELDHDSDRIAAFLAASGVAPGDVVAVQLPNWYETVAVAIGIFKAGAVVNPMLPVYRSKELRHMLRVGDTKAIFTPAEYRGFDHVAMIEELRDDIPSLGLHIVVQGKGGRAVPFENVIECTEAAPTGLIALADEVSELIFTSGTEAEPKAIMHTEQTTNFSVRTAFSSLGMDRSDVVWMPSPIGHSTGFNYGVRMALYHGLKLVLQDRWDGVEAADLIEANACSYTLAATTFVRDLVDACKKRSGDLSSMRLLGSGGAPVPPELVREAAHQGITVLRLYGSTEVLVGTWNRPESPLDKRTETDGIPVDGVEVVTRDASGSEVSGVAGEIYTRGPNTCVGFFNDGDRTKATFDADGWVQSGDLAVIDEAGYLTVVGRKKEIIIRGGLNIAPREVEEVILRLPAVASVAVVGLPHERLGEISCAVVVLQADSNLTLNALIDHLRSSGLAQYKWPERLEIVPVLPMTTTGKIRKHILASRFAKPTLEMTP